MLVNWLVTGKCGNLFEFDVVYTSTVEVGIYTSHVQKALRHMMLITRQMDFVTSTR